MTTTKPDSTTVDRAHRDGTSTPLPGLLAALRDELRAHRTQRAAHKQLVRELSTYTTPADLDDLSAILNRYDDEQTAPVRQILNQRRAA